MISGYTAFAKSLFLRTDDGYYTLEQDYEEKTIRLYYGPDQFMWGKLPTWLVIA